MLLPINLLCASGRRIWACCPTARARGAPRRAAPPNVVDPAWAAIEWTVAAGDAHRALLVARARLLRAGYAWYAVQVHQTKYLVEIGFSPDAGGLVAGRRGDGGIPGQILLGALSDRIGREIVWTVAASGFAICYAALLRSRAARRSRCSI